MSFLTFSSKCTVSSGRMGVFFVGLAKLHDTSSRSHFARQIVTKASGFFLLSANRRQVSRKSLIGLAERPRHMTTSGSFPSALTSYSFGILVLRALPIPIGTWTGTRRVTLIYEPYKAERRTVVDRHHFLFGRVTVNHHLLGVALSGVGTSYQGSCLPIRIYLCQEPFKYFPIKLILCFDGDRRRTKVCEPCLHL